MLGEPATGSYAVDWTDHETWSRPPRKPRTEQPEPATDNTDDGDGDGDGDGDQHCADREASFGHRRGNQGGQKDEAFYGYYLQAATTVKDEHGPRVPELARRMLLSSCHIDPPAAIVPVLERMTADNIKITDVLADSGYAYRVPATWALRIRSLGANLVQDLHPNDRGPNGTHMGATCSNGRLYCPATPAALLDIQPLPRAATPEQTASHDRQCDELARYKLSPISRHDTDGYHRVICPAVQGGLPPVSRTLDGLGRKTWARRFKCPNRGRRIRRSFVVRLLSWSGLVAGRSGRSPAISVLPIRRCVTGSTRLRSTLAVPRG